jgi:hypothetical protein
MFTTVRTYTGMPGVATQIAAKRESVEKLFRGVPGFAGYRLIGTADGFTSVTICETKEGCDESARVAMAWLRENLPGVHVNAPTVITGESHISFGAKPAR